MLQLEQPRLDLALFHRRHFIKFCTADDSSQWKIYCNRAIPVYGVPKSRKKKGHS